MNKLNLPSSSSYHYTRDALDNLGMSHFEYFQSESDSDNTLKMLDRLAGIDGFIKNRNDCIYTLATRNRFVRPEKPTIYTDFTIRGDKFNDVKSEFTKRISSINNGSLYPHFTIQAWFSASLFMCGAVVKTQNLYSFVKCQPQAVKTGFSDRPFYSVSWRDIKDCEYPILIATSSFYQV